MATNIPTPKQVAFASTSRGVSTSEISGTEVSSESPLPARESGETPKAQDPQYTLAELLLRLAIVFIPMIIVSTFLLLLLVLPRPWRVNFKDNGTEELPVNLTMVSNNAYYTSISPGKVSVVSGWASHAAFFVMPYFLVLFSYCVAREVALKRPAAEAIDNTREIHDLLHSLLTGAWKETWTWIKFIRQGKRYEAVNNLRALHLAAVGMMISLSFAGLLISGENWLHFVISSPNLRYYEDLQSVNVSDFRSWSSFTPDPDLCLQTLSSDLLDPFAPSDIIPCSLNNSIGLYDLSYPEIGYTMLESGIVSRNGSFNLQDWQGFIDWVSTYDTDNQIVTYVDPKTNQSHALLFYPPGAFQFDGTVEGLGASTNIGLDFVANTTSMSTECTSITQACQLFNATDSTSLNLSIPYNCSSMFSGDLNIPPYDGLEQFRGWDTSFYDMLNGFPKNISVASQLNPFYFNVTAAVFSTTLSDIDAEYDGEDLDIWDGAIVGAGSNRVAFALSCNSTIYDVQFSLINGSIVSFNATPSDPRKASIIKGPIQVGFGRHSLFNAANLAMLNTNLYISDAMAVAFSQIGMALASGAFINALNIKQRLRFDLVVTKVPKAPFWFLVVICFTYAAMGLVIFFIAFCLRRKEGYAKVQVQLLPREKLKLWKLAWGTFEQVKDLIHWGEVYERGRGDAYELYGRERRFL